MRLIIDYSKKMVTFPGQTEETKSHQIRIRTTDGRLMMSSAFTFAEAFTGALSIIQTEFIDPANQEQ